MGKREGYDCQNAIPVDPYSFPLMPEPEYILQEDMDKLINQIKELELENTQLPVQLNCAKERNHVL